MTASLLAQKLGVSQATVSLALNDNPAVNSETRRRVKEAALRFNYRPNRIARAMRTGRTRLIGVIVPSVRFSFYPDIIDEIERGARAHGAQCLLCQSHGSEEGLEAAISMLLEQQVDGLLLTPLDGFEKRPIHRHLGDIGLPVVFCDYDAGTKESAAASHNLEIGRMMARHLVGLGHRRIVFLQGNRRIRNYRMRFQGFRDYLKEAGVPLRPELVCGYDEPSATPVNPEESTARDSLGGYDAQGRPLDGGQVVEGLLDRGLTFTAVAAAGDLLAIPAMRALLKRKIDVPREVSVIGCSNLDAAVLLSPALTTIDQNAREIGREAVRQLFEKIGRPRSPVRRVRVTPSLIVRDSTARRKGPAR
jgi:LacI family transcriptional regulator